METGLIGLIVAGAGLVLAGAGVRLATRAVDREAGQRAVSVPLIVAVAGQMLSLLALLSTLILQAPPPAGHAYAAILWVLFGYAVFHSAVALVGLVFVLLRHRYGFISARRSGPPRIARLWSDYASVVTLIALAVGQIAAVV